MASDGVGQRWLEWGSRSAPALLLLHGLRSYAATFEPLARTLAGEWRCLALDARGRGGSQWDPAGNYHTDRYVRDVAELVDHLRLDAFVLLGHSMGGATALVYAAGHSGRVRGLIVEDMLPGSSLDGAGADRIRREVAATPADFADREEAAGYWRSLRPQASPVAIGSRVANTVSLDPGTGRWRWIPDMAGISAARLDVRRPPVDLWPAVRAVRCPTVVIRGGDSDFTSAEMLAEVSAANPVIAGVTVQDAGHYVHDDQPERFADEVRGFLRGLR